MHNLLIRIPTELTLLPAMEIAEWFYHSSTKYYLYEVGDRMIECDQQKYWYRDPHPRKWTWHILEGHQYDEYLNTLD